MSEPTPTSQSPRAKAPSSLILPILGGGVASAVALDVLAFDGPIGLGLTVALLLTVTALALAARRTKYFALLNTRWPLLAATAFFTLMLTLRESDWLIALNLVAVFTALTLFATSTARTPLSRSGFVGYTLQMTQVLVHTFIDVAIRVIPDTPWRKMSPPKLRDRLAEFTRSALFALFALLLFGSLLVAADQRFERFVTDIFHIPESLPVHVARTLVLIWFLVGFFHTALRPPPLNGFEEFTDKTRAGLEMLSILVSLNVLFAIFVAVQLETLFGGIDHVVATSDLTLSDYARRGFFELAIVATGALVLLRAAAHFAAGTVQQHWVRRMTLVMVALVGIIMASSLHRLWVYQVNFGLTEMRLYSSAFVIWLGAIFVLFTVAIVRDRLDRFATSFVIAAFAGVALLNVINPDARIVAVNLDRATEGKQVDLLRDRSSYELDTEYLTELSEDAVPTIVDMLDELPDSVREEAEDELNRIYDGSENDDWRSWHLARWRADRAVENR